MKVFTFVALILLSFNSLASKPSDVAKVTKLELVNLYLNISEDISEGFGEVIALEFRAVAPATIFADAEISVKLTRDTKKLYETQVIELVKELSNEKKVNGILVKFSYRFPEKENKK
ncbi:hypothetical protein A9Q84_16075 [Halobacteriovorax marinus]|uniref:Uncharacterized protein n=1 Tax=Halobacteriovorax marinus TaxID=97084 RepID=A0A1Y5F448_9BACT|nr:hypothetical protein A9Q84_16075 [Halobacteriovorax marinus]